MIAPEAATPSVAESVSSMRSRVHAGNNSPVNIDEIDHAAGHASQLMQLEGKSRVKSASANADVMVLNFGLFAFQDASLEMKNRERASPAYDGL